MGNLRACYLAHYSKPLTSLSIKQPPDHSNSQRWSVNYSIDFKIPQTTQGQHRTISDHGCSHSKTWIQPWTLGHQRNKTKQLNQMQTSILLPTAHFSPLKSFCSLKRGLTWKCACCVSSLCLDLVPCSVVTSVRQWPVCKEGPCAISHWNKLSSRLTHIEFSLSTIHFGRAIPNLVAAWGKK